MPESWWVFLSTEHSVKAADREWLFNRWARKIKGGKKKTPGRRTGRGRLQECPLLTAKCDAQFQGFGI